MSISRERHYVVVVCPKCRIQSQIVEDTGQKTIRCQNCGANLLFRKLRQFHNSTDIQEAIVARTKLQASISGEGTNKISPVIEVEESKIKGKTEDKLLPKKPVELILSSIPPEETISYADLKHHAGSMGVEEEKMGEILHKLLESGHIYEPKNGFFRRA